MAIENKNINDVFLRNQTLAILDLFNNRANTEQVEDCDVYDPKRYPIPFFYNFSSDENFLKDFYINLPDDCKIPVHAEGNYDPLPRGIVTFTGMTIRSNDIVNKFVRGTFQKEIKGANNERVTKVFNSRLFAIPLTLTYDVDVKTASLNQAFKVVQSIIEVFYKNNIMYYQYRGLRMQSNIQFPESYNVEKILKFSYTDDNKIDIKFTCEVETYYPAFDDTTERFRGNIMKEIDSTIYDQKSSEKLSTDKITDTTVTNANKISIDNFTIGDSFEIS